jgi:ABC-type lipoprotein export system ATPase subunit
VSALIGALDAAPAARGVLELDGVTKHYPGTPPVKALDGVDLRVQEGEFVVIVGPSGSGKSTLMNIVGALQRPTGGTVRIDGVGLGPRATHRPGALSGGERQRVAIARALVGDPAIVLADEPTGNLDSSTSDAIVDLLADLHRRGRTIVLITHDREVAARAPRRVAILDGRITTDSDHAEDAA